MRQKYYLIDSLGKGALLAFFLTPIARDVPWLNTVLTILSVVCFSTALILLVVWGAKKQLNLIDTVIADYRGSLFDVMVFLVGTVSFYVTSNQRMACLWLSLALINTILVLVQLFRGDSDKEKQSDRRRPAGPLTGDPED